MRKVYQNDTRLAGLPASMAFSVLFTALLFGFIPFAHRINKPERTLVLTSTRAVDLPPPDQEKPPTPPELEAESPLEAPPAPQLTEAAQPIPLSADLEVALGSGGALAGFGEIRALAATETVRQEVFDVSDLEQRPEPVSQVPPVYPPELKKARIEGLVTLVFVLSEEGRVEDPRVEHSTRPEFERPALEAIRKWRFRPGMREGRPVRSFIRQPLRFRVPSG